MSDISTHMKCIDYKTDDLLEIADVLEEYQVNVRLDDGRYLNPVSAIRNKVDIIWEEVQAIAATLGSGECEFKPFAGEDWDEPNAVRGVCSECSALMYGKDNYCPNCGRRVKR